MHVEVKPFWIGYHIRPHFHFAFAVLSTNGILRISHVIMWITISPGYENVNVWGNEL